jgi:uncharacterized protein with von Willebrand factor type A (vWA) domain
MGQHKVKGASTGAYAQRRAFKEALASLIVKAQRKLSLLGAFFHAAAPSYPDYHPQLTTTSAKGKSRSQKERRIRRYKHRQKMVSIRNA